MAKICHICSKGPGFGQNRSHSMRATKRRFDANLQRIRIVENGTPKRAYVCTKCIKSDKVAKVAKSTSTKA
jgi:large subunit ribosomal protein L28